MKHQCSLLVLAGGLGSRYKGQKQVDTVSTNDETLMEFGLYDAIKVGIKKFVFIINNQFPPAYKTRLEKIFNEVGCEVHFIEQTIETFIPAKFSSKLEGRVKPLGTAHAIYCAKEVINEPFITMNADDFYGANTFKIALDSVAKNLITSDNFGMLAFKLQNTLSDNGTVSRGICTVKENVLQKVEEFTSIKNEQGVVKGQSPKGEVCTLNLTDVVSMNLWLLHPHFFKMVEKGIEDFLENLENTLKGEYYIPTVIDDGLNRKEISVSVFTTDEKWFGMTYQEDKDIVVEELASKKKQGLYPARLWSNL